MFCGCTVVTVATSNAGPTVLLLAVLCLWGFYPRALVIVSVGLNLALLALLSRLFCFFKDFFSSQALLRFRSLV